MPLRRIPVACIQTQASDRNDFETRWPRTLALVDDAARAGARLIVLPEGTVPAYVLGTTPVEPALLARAQRDLASIARISGSTIVYGGARIVDGRTYNAANVLGPDGADLGFAAKQFLWQFDRRWFAPGETLLPVATPVGMLGLLVCADGRLPTIARTLVERGAEALVMPTAWVTSGRDPTALENIQADLMANVRARENGVPFVAANKCDVELESVAYCGKSAIIAADGSFVARAGERDEETIAGEIELGAPPRSHPTALAVDDETRRAQLDPARLLRARQRLRVAFGALDDALELARFTDLAEQTDADVLLLPASHASEGGRIGAVGDVPIGFITEAILENPAGLVPARLAGFDLFLVTVKNATARATVALARTRAAELRIYLVVLGGTRGRSFAVDPDGAIIAGTFDRYRIAAFTYDRARSQATTVAPTTDVLDGLRTAARIASRKEPSSSGR